MKKSILMLLFALALGVSAKGESNTLMEARHFIHEYSGVRINDIGLPETVSGTDLMEMADTKDGPKINGIIPGLPGYWLQGKWWRPDWHLTPGTELTRDNSDENEPELCFYPAQLELRSDGTYRIVTRSVYDWSDGFNWLSINGWHDNGGVMEYPYASNREGYAVFEKKNGVLTAYNNFMETEARFIPTEEYSYYPPTELSKPMQITAFNRAGIQTQVDTPENLQGKLVNGVVYNNSVYLGGLFGNSDNVWLKGDIVGDKVIFKNGSPYGSTGLYLSTCYYKKGSAAYGGNLIPSNEDLVFSYSESDGEPYLYEPSVGFTATQNPGELDTWGFWNNIYFGSEISRFYDVAMTPQVPTRINYDCNHRNCALSFCISNISEDGEVMDPNRLFYRIFINDELYVLKIQGKDVAEIPYSYPSDAGGFVDGYREIPFEMLSTLNLKIEMDMVYYGGGVKTYSPGSIGEAKIENLNAEEYNNQNVYDIYGRKVTDGDLKTGLYIRNGKKFIVR